ncbi:MAG: hypothetical protein D6761_09505 [Candidatus Dadabacteria bacterium]|nr:MAG: hypothetical protein D6761_09505 [Candidatus Dadabacteria bacterium]
MRRRNPYLVAFFLVVFSAGCGPVLCNQHDYRVADKNFGIDLSDAEVVLTEPSKGNAPPESHYMTVETARDVTAVIERIPFLFADTITIAVQKGKKARVYDASEAPPEFFATERVITYEDGRITIEYVVDGHRVQEIFRVRASEINSWEPDSCAE